MTNHLDTVQMSSNEGADFWYYEVGVNVIPVDSCLKNEKDPEKKKKFCKISWSRYETEELDEETFKDWKEQGLFECGIAIIGGHVWRGKFEGMYLVMIDTDNQLGFDEMYPKGTQSVKDHTLMEQHADMPHKAHTYFYLERPIKNKRVSGSEDKLGHPAIEIKSDGPDGIHIVSPSIHSGGHRYEIVSTGRFPKVRKADDIEQHIDEICKKYEIPYLNTEQRFGYEETDFQKYIKPDFKIGESEGRRPALLVVCNHYFWKRQERLDDPDMFTEVLQLAKQWNQQHCTVLLSDEQVEYQNECAFRNAKKMMDNGTMYPLTKSINVIKLDSLTDIEKAEYAGKTVRVNAVIASNSIAYNVPKEFEAKCVSSEEQHMCKGQTAIKITLSPDTMVGFVDIPSEKRGSKITGIIKNKFTKYCEIEKQQKKTTTLQKFKIRPIISSLYKKEKDFFDDDGNKWSSYDIFVENNKDTIKIEAGREVEIVGLVMADPKNQKVTLFANSMRILNENEFDSEKVKQIHERFKNQSVWDTMDWLTGEFEKYSRIIKRRNVAEMGLLTFFSPLYINFEGQNIPGWLKSLVIGDSTVGKSETVRKLIILLKAGQIVSGEMATVAGLAGAAVQTSGGQWFVDFGVLPMQDRKMLAIDGAHILRQEELAKLAEAERNGTIEIVKASKGEAYARTRQIKIMNPVDDDRTTTVSMDSFFYPVNSLINNFHIQSIARIDFACFVSDDVSAADRNVQGDVEYDSLLEDMSELLRLVWSMKYTVKFTDDALHEILVQSTELETKFKNETIPLITNDQKYKLAKLSASLACLSCSFNDTYDVVTVTDEHVRYISELITTEYHTAGLDELVRKSKHDKVDLEMLYRVIKDVGRKINSDDTQEIINVFRWLAETGKFQKEELQEHFDLSRDSQLKPLLGYLSDEKVIKRGKTGFTVLRYGTEIGRFIVDFSNSSNSRRSETDTPLNNNNEKKEGVSLLDSLEELERRKIKDFRCKHCNQHWRHTESSLEDVQDEHNTGVVSGHVIVED